MTCTTVPWRSRMPVTTRILALTAMNRCFSKVAAHTTMLHVPVSSSRVTKTTPLAVPGLVLAFGYLGSDEPQDIVAVGRLVADALRAQGLTVEWDGSAKRRIGVSGMRWQRRTPG